MSPRSIACFTFDNMGEAADVGAGASPAPDSRHPSLETGYPSVLALLERQRIRATFFVEGWNGERHPREVAEIVQHGHELGMHGWLHEAWSALDPERERDLAARATQALEGAAGVRPCGFRAPGGARSANTETVLGELGYRYDASLGDGMRPTLLSSGLAQVPFVWPGVDGFYYLRQPAADPTSVREAWLAALRRTAESGGLFVLICHPFITGVDPERVAALEAVMRSAQEDERVEIKTAGEVAAGLQALTG